MIDEVVAEPLGGAHRDKQATVQAVGERLVAALAGLGGEDANGVRSNRREKFLEMGSKGLT